MGILLSTDKSSVNLLTLASLGLRSPLKNVKGIYEKASIPVILNKVGNKTL
jgi:hypothetical protein